MGPTKCDKDSDVTPLTNQELGHRVRSLETAQAAQAELLTRLAVDMAELRAHAKHMRISSDRMENNISWAVKIIVGTVMAAILALLWKGNGSVHGTGSGSVSAVSAP